VKRKVLAGLIAAVAALTLSACAAASPFDAAAKQADAFSTEYQAAEGDSEAQAAIAAEAQEYLDAVEADTGCVLVGVDGGPITDENRAELTKAVNAQLAELRKTNPDYETGVYFGETSGAFVVFDCAPEASAANGN